MPTASSPASDAPSLVERNRAVHRMLVDGVTVEYRRKDGSIAGAQARVIDFDVPDNNDWLAVNQFTVCRGAAQAAAGHRAVRQRPAARGDRAQEPGRRERDRLVRLPAAPDLPGTDPIAVRDQRGAGRLRRRAGADRLARRRARSGSSRGARSPAGRTPPQHLPELQVVLEGVFEQAAVPRPGALLHRVRGLAGGGASS